MATGHHGANHPVKDLETGKVEITSMNHGFTVDAETLPDDVVQTVNSRIRFTNREGTKRVDDVEVFDFFAFDEVPAPQQIDGVGCRRRRGYRREAWSVEHELSLEDRRGPSALRHRRPR